MSNLWSQARPKKLYPAMASHHEGLVRVDEKVEEHQRRANIAHDPNVQVGGPPHDLRHVGL